MLNYCKKAISCRINQWQYILLCHYCHNVVFQLPTSTCVITPNCLTHIYLIAEEWLHKMCKKTFAQKPFVMTWFCAIVQWSSSSSILSHHSHVVNNCTLSSVKVYLKKLQPLVYLASLREPVVSGIAKFTVNPMKPPKVQDWSDHSKTFCYNNPPPIILPKGFITSHASYHSPASIPILLPQRKINYCDMLKL